MKNSADVTPKIPPHDNNWRCPACDTLNPIDSRTCMGCGAKFNADSPLFKGTTQLKQRPRRLPSGQPLILKFISIFLVFGALGLTILIWSDPAPLTLAFLPTATPTILISPTLTRTPIPPAPTRTPTLPPSFTPTPSLPPTPLPTPTLEPPSPYEVKEGEVLANIALSHRVSLQSILELNKDLSADKIIAGQKLLIPRPTVRPPLERVNVEIDGEVVIADPADCKMHKVKDKDTYFSLATEYDLPYQAILAVNQLTEQNAPHIGDELCMPKIIYNVSPLEQDKLARTAAFSPPPYPIFPMLGSVVESREPINFQWVTQAELQGNEWFMLELFNLSNGDAHPRRYFTQETSWQLSAEQLPEIETDFRWRVRIVTISKQLADGNYVYNSQHQASDAQFHFVP